MQTATALRAAADTNAGLQREVNEDRIHLDLARGLFLVIDGVGGHPAGGRAADIALATVRDRLERETAPLVNRVREAIAAANNDIHRAAASRPEWNGMACVLTVVVVDDTRAVVGHVGDTRLYKLREQRIDKMTRDHSPIGEREDSNELSELEAMHHPRRNEVYRDVGSDPHQPDDPEFIDAYEIAFEPDAALLLCSDGLTDLVQSSSLHDIVKRYAGRPDRVVKALIDAANAAGGKDNVSVVYVESERFAPAGHCEKRRQEEAAAPGPRTNASRAAWLAGIALAAASISAAAVSLGPFGPMLRPPPNREPAVTGATLAVAPTESIAAALQRAAAGTVVLVEPGEYRETLRLKDGVRIVSRVPRAATLRLSGTASEGDTAVIAAGVVGAEFAGFRIIGDAATPLGTGVLIRASQTSLVDIEVTGAANAAIAVDGMSVAAILASDVHDNPGSAVTIRGAAARLAHNVFMRNGTSEHVRRPFIIDKGADPLVTGNVFHDVSRDTFADLSDGARAALSRDNWFMAVPDVHSTSSTTASIRPGSW